MKKLLKIVGILFLIIVLIVVIGASSIHFGSTPSYPTNPPELQIEADSAMLAEGKRLAAMVCNGCHRSANGTLEGNFMADVPIEFGKAWAPNITQHSEYGIGKYTAGDLAFLIRTGIKKNGDYAPPWMPKFPHLSDYDLHSIIAYLKSDAREVQPSEKVQPTPEPSFLMKFLLRVAFKPFDYPTEKIEAPPISDKVAYGKYMSTAKVECFSCHSADFKTVDALTPENSVGFFGGGNPLLDLEGNLVPSSNITMDKETGIGNWTEAEFIEAVRFLKRPDGTNLSYPMAAYSAMSEEEVSAIWAYLQTVPPIKNKVTR